MPVSPLRLPGAGLGVEAASFRVPSGTRLFREATQLKTVAAIAHVTRIEVMRMEIQVHPRGADRRRIPKIPAFANEA